LYCIDDLVTFVIKKKFTMINNDDFAKRLKKVIEFYQLSASSFAEKINVQRSSISHLLSGRNKPSLDFVIKVLDTFEEVDMYWLLKGEGEFPKSKKTLDYPTTLFPDDNNEIEKTIETNIIKDKTVSSNNLNIDKIVIFFKNGTFKLYNEL